MAAAPRLQRSPCCRTAICHRIEYGFAIQVSANYQRPRFRWVTDANLSFEAASETLRHSIAVCVPFTGTPLLYGFARDQTIHNQCNEARGRHGVEKIGKIQRNLGYRDGLPSSWPSATNWLTFACAVIASIFARHSSNSLFSRKLVRNPTSENNVMKKSSAIRMRSLA